MIKVTEKFKINYIDASSLCEFSRCPAKYMFDRLMGLKLPDRDMIALDFGTDMHVAIPFCYDGEGCVAQALDAFIREWEPRGYEDDPKRNITRAEAMLENFADNHAPNICAYTVVDFPDIDIPTDEAIGQHEVPFLIDIGGDLPYAGRLDASVIWRSTNDLWSLDYKNMSEVSPRLFKNFHNAPQSVGNTYALSHLTGKKVQGMIIEALRVSKVNCENQLAHIYVQDHQIESYINFVKRQSALMIAYNEAKVWPKTNSGCAPYSMFGGAGYMCDYKDICDCPDWTQAARFYKRCEPFHPFEMRD